ncbi:hypothetical protein ACRWC7_18730 [Escherichia coli]
MKKKVIAALFLCSVPFVAISAVKNITFSDSEKVMLKHLFKYDLQQFIHSEAHMFSYETVKELPLKKSPNWVPMV